ncbi:LptA/OstA family protein [Escherichia coli]
MGGEQGKEVIDGYGKPATFYQMQDNGKPVEGHASQMHYELAKDFVVLTGNAYLQQVIATLRAIDHLPVKEHKCRLSATKASA